MFKAGDKVKNKSGATFSNGEFVNTVEKISEGGRVWILETGMWVYAEGIEHESPTASPTRTVTRREIVPGDYGRIRVRTERGVNIALLNQWNPWNAEELREAAHVLNQLAEALEDKP